MLSDQEVRNRIATVPHWYHRMELRPGIVTPGVNDSSKLLDLLNLPRDCRGLRALDLGTRDGFFAFELERRGAEVLAVDYCPAEETGFHVAAGVLESRVVHLQENVYNLSKEKLGTFDIVLFLGLIYHLPDPILVLNIVRSLCTDLLYLETHVIDNCLLMPSGRVRRLDSLSKLLRTIPLMQFYPGKSLNNDHSNFWGPNVKCMERMLVDSDFRVTSTLLNGSRALFTCTVNRSATREYAFTARGSALSA